MAPVVEEDVLLAAGELPQGDTPAQEQGSRLQAVDGGRAVSSDMMFPPIPWETIGSVVYGGAVVYAAVGGLASGACLLLMLVSRVQRRRRGRASLER